MALTDLNSILGNLGFRTKDLRIDDQTAAFIAKTDKTAGNVQDTTSAKTNAASGVSSTGAAGSVADGILQGEEAVRFQTFLDEAVAGAKSMEELRTQVTDYLGSVPSLTDYQTQMIISNLYSSLTQQSLLNGSSTSLGVLNTLSLLSGQTAATDGTTLTSSLSALSTLSSNYSSLLGTTSGLDLSG